jgi:glutamate--cysteine ligase
MLPLAVQAAMAAIEKICPEARNLLIVPENQATNTFYLSNLAQLRRVFHLAGLNVRMGSISPDIKKSVTIDLPDGDSITLEPVVRTKGRLGVKNFDPCTILLNNDLRAGVPGILEDLHEQYLLPPLHAGWATRRKSTHAKCFEEVSKRFGKLIGVDHWLINPLFEKCDQVDFSTEAGVQELAARVDALLGKIRKKHKEYGIKEKPFVVVKADNGDARMGVLTVRDSKELEALRQQVPGRAGAGKGVSGVYDVILQEGVLTCERVNDAVAEPVVYLMDRYVVGGFYRVHAERKVDENLSGPGSSFVPLAFAESTHLPQPGVKPGASAPNRFYMYGVVGRLAMLASSYELEATDPDAERYD